MVLKQKFGNSFLNIYKHYSEMSERRRHQEYGAESNAKSLKLNSPGAASRHETLTPEMKALHKKLKHTLGYKEFFKVRDFSDVQSSTSISLTLFALISCACFAVCS